MRKILYTVGLLLPLVLSAREPGAGEADGALVMNCVNGLREADPEAYVAAKLRAWGAEARFEGILVGATGDAELAARKVQEQYRAFFQEGGFREPLPGFVRAARPFRELRGRFGQGCLIVRGRFETKWQP